MENRMSMSTKLHTTPARTLLPSPIEKTPPTSHKKRALTELSINLPPRPHSAQEFTTPEHPNSYKKTRKVSEPYSRVAPIGPLTTSKRDSPGEDSVWGPDVEAAFMSAIRCIPKLGRRKIYIGSKPCGRNELIAAFICRRTGKVRTRKQVSSHIQVLKHIRRDDAEFLALVADGKDEDLDSISPKFDANDMDKLVQSDQHAASQRYQLSTSIDEDQSPLGKMQRYKNQALAVVRTKLQIEEFCIWTSKMPVGTAEEQVLHVYTTYEKPTSGQVLPIDAISDWALRFPCLPQLILDPTFSQCPVFHVHASVNLAEATNLFANPEEQAVVRNQLFMSGIVQKAQEQCLCITRVYSMNNKVLEEVQQILPVQSDAMSQNGEMLVEIPFARAFWGAFFEGLAHLEDTMQDIRPEDRRAKCERDSQKAVSGVTVVQELVSMASTMVPSKRLGVLMWEFNKTQPQEEGQTIVTRVAFPDSQVGASFQALPMSRTVSQPQSLSRKPIARPKLGGANLQRSQSMAAVTQQPYYNAPTSMNQARPRHLASQMPYSQPMQQANGAQSANASMYYQPVFDQPQLLGRQMQSSSPLDTAFTYGAPTPSTQAVSYAMARSYSAPSWGAGTAPSQYPSSMDTSLWNDNIFDWTLPESAGYLETDFQIPSDDLYITTPSRSQSAAPQTFALEHTTSTAGTELDDLDESRLPQLGFFPLTNF